MPTYLRAGAMLTVALFITLVGRAVADDAIVTDASTALQSLYGSEPVAKMIGEKAKAVLVFPSIVKAGFIVGGQYGEGVLLENGKFVGIITLWRLPTACRPACRSLATRCF